MPQYRRRFAPGGRYFFTVVLAERGSDLLVREIGALRAAVAAELRRRPFDVAAWGVMPDHMHCVWALPEGDADFPAAAPGIKAGFARRLPQVEGSGRARKGVRGIWQRRDRGIASAIRPISRRMSGIAGGTRCGTASCGGRRIGRGRRIGAISGGGGGTRARPPRRG